MLARLLPLWAPLSLLIVAPLGGPFVGEALGRTRGKAAAGGSGHAIQKSGHKTNHKAGRRGRGRTKKRREPPPQMPSEIDLKAIDLTTGITHVEVVGTTRPPATRLFLFTDTSGRRFVPAFAECHPPLGVTLPDAPTAAAGEEGEDDEPAATAGTPELPAGTRWRCVLTIPRLYRRAPLASLTMEWGNLAVAVPAEQVQRLWGEARAAAPLSTLAERNHDAPATKPEPVSPRPALPTGANEDPHGDEDDDDHDDPGPGGGAGDN